MRLRGGRGRYCRARWPRQSDRGPSSCPGAWWRTRLACGKDQTASDFGFQLAVHSALSCHYLPVNEIAILFGKRTVNPSCSPYHSYLLYGRKYRLYSSCCQVYYFYTENMIYC